MISKCLSLERTPSEQPKKKQKRPQQPSAKQKSNHTTKGKRKKPQKNGTRSQVHIQCDPTQRTRLTPQQPALQAPVMKSMLAERRQRSHLLHLELGQTDPTAIHPLSTQLELQLHPPVLRHAPPLQLNTPEEGDIAIARNGAAGTGGGIRGGCGWRAGPRWCCRSCRWRPLRPRRQG